MSGSDASKMHQHERHRLILERAKGLSRVEVLPLADELDVTPETIRRDLTALERQGLVRRVHGGAIHVDRLGFEPTVAMRSERLAAEKERIGSAALGHLPAGGTILIDGGTTTLQLARQLPPETDLTIVTNSLPAAVHLVDLPRVQVHLIGGMLRPTTKAAVGSWARIALTDVVIDVAFIGTNGLTTSQGLTTPDASEAETKAAMVQAARRVVCMADHSKVGASQFRRFATLPDIDVLITDTGLDDETTEDIAARGPEVVRA